MSEDLATTVERLARRVQALEDELAIRQMLARYGFAVDTNNVDAMLALFHPDIRVVVDGKWEMRGHDAAREIVEGEVHQSYLPNCAHNLDPFSIVVDGDRATATGYSRVYLRTGEGFRVERVSFNRYELQRFDDRWLVVERHTALLGSGEVAHDLLSRGL
jgi:uncharacterized protein (TIGR02246 family)